MTSGGHGLRIKDDYSKQECLVLTPTKMSLKQKYFSDYPRYQVKHLSGPMMVASCWSGQKEDICPSMKKSMDKFIKVNILWEGRKIWKKKSPTCFDVYSVVSKQVRYSFKFLWPFRKTWTFQPDRIVSTLSAYSILRWNVRQLFSTCQPGTC